MLLLLLLHAYLQNANSVPTLDATTRHKL